MAKFLYAIDGAIIDYAFQPVCNRLVNVATPRRIALFFLTGDIAATGFGFCYNWAVKREVSFALGLCSISSLVGYALASSRPDTTSRAGNPMRVTPFAAGFRLMSIVMAILVMLDISNVVDEAFTVSFWMYAAYVYFDACDRPPPVERWVWGVVEVREYE